MNKRIEALRRDQSLWITERQSLHERLALAEEKLAWIEGQNSPETTSVSPVVVNTSEPRQRIVALENQVRALQQAFDRQPIGVAIPEYDPTRQPLASQPAVNTPPKRSWGTEQVIGPPDTVRPGDAPTAWAPLKANAGTEWLAVGFEQAVEVAQVRIRETYNPGAISKVTAVVNNEEVTLWEGTAAPGDTPRDFVVPVSEGVQTDSIVVHVDTTRVGSWTEIDAVEVVGRDGSRQWAKSAEASSTFADKARSASEMAY
ncbi:MAG TPA: hypothetical protein VFZ59_20505 [Verrucomicrobiae bacterium]|nr:hypothetical protein [Verrucomicrobiae bacterium]